MRKAQAAMEFLMTYGWAILVVLAAIGALAYFGVLSPDRFLPDKCIVQGGFSCKDYKIDGTSDEIRFRVINNLGVAAENVSVRLDTNDCTLADEWSNATSTLDNRDEYAAAFQCGANISGSFSGDIEVHYNRVNEAESHIARGSITGGVEQ